MKMKNILAASMIVMIPFLVTSCMSSGAPVGQMGASKKKFYHTSKVPNARSGKKYKTGL
jgi:hypothetical protein